MSYCPICPLCYRTFFFFECVYNVKSTDLLCTALMHCLSRVFKLRPCVVCLFLTRPMSCDWLLSAAPLFTFSLPPNIRSAGSKILRKPLRLEAHGLVEGLSSKTRSRAKVQGGASVPLQVRRRRRRGDGPS